MQRLQELGIALLILGVALAVAYFFNDQLPTFPNPSGGTWVVMKPPELLVYAALGAGVLSFFFGTFGRIAQKDKQRGEKSEK